MEGAAAQAVFRAYAAVLPARYGFKGRNRRPPRDPVNALLSLTYTLLNARLHAILLGQGFDPALGYLHDPAHGRNGLPLDMLELYRAKADWQVWRWLSENTLRMDDFTRDQDACLLNKAGRRKYYAAFEDWIPVIERDMRRTISRLRARLLWQAPGTEA